MSGSTICVRIENSAIDLDCFPVGTWYNDLTTGWATEELWIDSRKRGIFFLLQYVRTGSASSPTSISWGLVALYAEVKRPGRENDHLLPPSDEVKNAWSCTSTILCVCFACAGVTYVYLYFVCTCFPFCLVYAYFLLS